MSTRDPSRRYDAVQQDWRAFLPEAKADLFEIHTRELENSYLMLSVSLNEAMDLRQQGQGLKSLQAVGVAAELCALFAVRINAVLQGMGQQARHFGTVPNLAPLAPSNFRSERAQRLARFSNLLSFVLLSQRSQFLEKISALEEIVRTLDEGFAETAERLADYEGTAGAEPWAKLDACHFDLNTCLRETDVLFKSFLLALPEDQLAGLDFTIRELSRARPPAHSPGASLIRARRMGAVAGK
jgi:hypothetical protein